MANESAEIRQQMEHTRHSLTEKLDMLETHVTTKLHDASEAVAGSVATVKEAVDDTVQAVKESVKTTTDCVRDTFDMRRQAAPPVDHDGRGDCVGLCGRPAVPCPPPMPASVRAIRGTFRAARVRITACRKTWGESPPTITLPMRTLSHGVCSRAWARHSGRRLPR